MMNWFKKLMLLRLLILIIQSKKTDYDTKISEIKKKITGHDHSNKNIATKEFNKLTAEHFVASLKQANLTTKGDIDNFFRKDRF